MSFPHRGEVWLVDMGMEGKSVHASFSLVTLTALSLQLFRIQRHFGDLVSNAREMCAF